MIYSKSPSKEGITEDLFLLSLISTALKKGSVGRFFIFMDRSDPIVTSWICIAPVWELSLPAAMYKKPVLV